MIREIVGRYWFLAGLIALGCWAVVIGGGADDPESYSNEDANKYDFEHDQPPGWWLEYQQTEGAEFTDFMNTQEAEGKRATEVAGG